MGDLRNKFRKLEEEARILAMRPPDRAAAVYSFIALSACRATWPLCENDDARANRSN